MDIPQGVDLTKDMTHSPAYVRVTEGFRAGFGITYAIGQALQLASQDLQVYPDGLTTNIPAATVSLQGIVGLVSEDWFGFGPSGGTFLSGANANLRGTQIVKVTTWGYHPAALIDNSAGSGVSAITHRSVLTTSAATAGYLSTPSSIVAGAVVAHAMLPASSASSNTDFTNISLGNGTVTQASNTWVVTGSPAAGDVYTITLQIPYQPFTVYGTLGVKQTHTVSITLTAASATSTTTAAAAMVAACQADSIFPSYFTFGNSSSATMTVTALATNPFNITQANGAQFALNLSGTVGNNITITGTVTGTGTLTVTGALLASGAGYKGICPVWLSWC